MKTYLTVVWTCSLWNYNLTQVERVKSELKQKSYGLSKSSGKTINNWKHILDLTETKYAFKRRKQNMRRRFVLRVKTQILVRVFLQNSQRRGIGHPRPLNLRWAVEIRREGVRVTDSELDGGAQPQTTESSLEFMNPAI